MVEGPASNDTRPSLTVSSAASEIESLISPDFTIGPDKKSAAVKTPAKEPVSDDDAQPELPASEDESEAPDEMEAAESEDTDPVDPDSENAQLEGDDEPEVDAEPWKSQKHRVKVRGAEEEVSYDELLNGYSRTSDYTRSKQELALEKAKFEKEEKTAVRESAKKYAEGIAQIAETLKAMQPQEPDWDKLAMEAPEDFARQRALWQLNQERLHAVEMERQRAAEQVQRDQQETYKQTVAQENELLLEMVPEWKDNKVAVQEKSEIAKYVKELGFTDEDLKAVVKANQMMLLRNAYLYSKSLAKKSTIQKKIEKVKVATPGPAAEKRPGERAQERRMQRLRKDGSVKNAAAVLEHIPGLLDNI